MRAGLTKDMDGGSAGAMFHVERVTCGYWRDFWFRSRWTGSAYELKAYRTEANARADASALATATHAAGAVDVAMTVAGGAPFNPTPLTVTLTASGTWTQAIAGWVAAVEQELLERAVALLEKYTAANEALEGVPVFMGGVLPNALPAVGVMIATTSMDDLKPSGNERGLFDMDLVAAAYSLDPDAGAAECTRLGGVLRSIALDEQRTWGGLAFDTRPRGTMNLAAEEAPNDDNGGLLYIATVPVSVVLLALEPSQDAAYPGPGSGGKYAATL